MTTKEAITKEELLDTLSGKTNLSKQAVDNVIKVLNEVVVDYLRRGRRVIVSPLGVFDTKNVREKKANHPITGKLIKIPPMRVPRFRFSVGFKKAVR